MGTFESFTGFAPTKQSLPVTLDGSRHRAFSSTANNFESKHHSEQNQTKENITKTKREQLRHCLELSLPALWRFAQVASCSFSSIDH